jgi:DeoR family fructose operon transcriptional repressor
MYAEERQQHILDSARTAGRVEVNALAETLDVTPRRFRRDLTILERTESCAASTAARSPSSELGFEPGVETRSDRFVVEKERIAKAALAHLPDGGTVLLDAGTTTLRLAEQLPRDRELTIVTNSLGSPRWSPSTRTSPSTCSVAGCAGRTLAAVGSWLTNALQDVFVDVAFIGTNGLSVKRGLTTPDQSEAAAKRAMISAAGAASS